MMKYPEASSTFVSNKTFGDVLLFKIKVKSLMFRLIQAEDKSTVDMQ
ncbi:MAG: hypothetical protein ACTS4W_00945 [Candidatus Hodgkinia cicadicola]